MSKDVSSKKQLCPDCKEEYISDEVMRTTGKCKQCMRRESNLLARGLEYIKFCDLTETEKSAIRSRREYQKRAYDNKNTKRSKNRNVSSKTSTRNYGIFTPNVIKYLQEISDGTLGMKELKSKMIEKFPNTFSASDVTMYGILRKYNIDYRKNNRRTSSSKNQIYDEQESMFIDDNNDIYVDVSESKVPDENNITATCVINNVNNTVTDKSLEMRFAPIREEVQTVLKSKFIQNNCNIQKDYTLEDYLNMINMMFELCKNIETNIACRKKQELIFNDYQGDIVHEMENVVSENGDTYFQDKMNVLREYRRIAKMDIDALEALKPVVSVLRTMLPQLRSTGKSTLSTCKETLESLQRIINQKVYIPRVDRYMTYKYEWALDKEPPRKKVAYGSDYSNKTSNIKPRTRQVVEKSDTDLPNIQLSQEQIDSGVGVYRVSCRISGGGYGTFTHWHKDYCCVNDQMATAMANQEFARMKSLNKSILITDIGCHKLNVGGM